MWSGGGIIVIGVDCVGERAGIADDATASPEVAGASRPLSAGFRGAQAAIRLASPTAASPRSPATRELSGVPEGSELSGVKIQVER